MALAHFQRTFTDTAGNVQPSLEVTIRNESTGAIAAIFTDSAGTTPKDNPFTTDSFGYGDFYAADGRYRIQATGIDWRNEEVLTFENLAAAVTEAEEARDAALVNGDIYADTAAGLAATVDGEYFSTPAAASDEYLTLYRNDSGVATEIDTYPNSTAVDNVFTELNKRTIYVGSVAELSSLLSPLDGAFYDVYSYHSDRKDGGGIYRYDSGRDKADHDGGYVIDPDKVFPSDWDVMADRLDWLRNTNTGTGCFVRRIDKPYIDPAEYGAKGIAPITGALSDYHDDSISVQNASDKATELELYKVVFGVGCFGINDASNPTWGRVHFFASAASGRRFLVHGAGRGATFFRNTESMPAGDMFCTNAVGTFEQRSNGGIEFKHFTILETFQGFTDGTGGANPLTAAFADALIVNDVDIFNSGNRAIAIENGTETKTASEVSVRRVRIENAWKNAISINAYNPSLTDKLLINIDNVWINGFNLVVDAGGTYTSQNNGINIVAGPGYDITTNIDRVVGKNGFASLFRQNGGTVNWGDVTAESLEIIDVSSVNNQCAVYMGADTYNINTVNVRGVIAGGGVLFNTDGHAHRVMVDSSLFGLRSLSSALSVTVDNAETTQCTTGIYTADAFTIENYKSDGAGTLLSDISGNAASEMKFRSQINVRQPIDITSFQFTDARIKKRVTTNIIMDEGTAGLGAYEFVSAGLRLKSYSGSAEVLYIQLPITLDTAKTYDVAIKLDSISGGAISVYFGATTVISGVIGTTEVTASGVSTSSNDTLLRIGRRDANFPANGEIVIDYLTITENP